MILINQLQSKLPALQTRRILHHHWDKRFTTHSNLFFWPLPKNGWIQTARFCLGMTLQDIAIRIKTIDGQALNRTAIAGFERQERNGGIKLRTLKAIAEAMNCDFVYYFVPKENGSFEQSVLKQREIQKRKKIYTFRSLRNLWKESDS